MECGTHILSVAQAFSLAHPCTAEAVWGPVAGLVIEDVGVRDKSSLENPQQIDHYPALRTGSCSIADISIYICHFCTPSETERRRGKAAGVRLVCGHEQNM